MSHFDRTSHVVSLWCLGALLFAAAAGPRASAAGELLKVGDTAPPFTLTAVDGSAFTLTDALKRRAVLVAFLSSPCKPCEDNIPAIAKLCGRFSREGRAQVVGIVMTGKEAIVKAFEGQQPMCRPLLMDDLLRDEGYQTADAYGVKGTPVFFLVGRDGRIAWRHIGRIDDEKMNAVIEAALAR